MCTLASPRVRLVVTQKKGSHRSSNRWGQRRATAGRSGEWGAQDSRREGDRFAKRRGQTEGSGTLASAIMWNIREKQPGTGDQVTFHLAHYTGTLRWSHEALCSRKAKDHTL